ncbi:hypothetical protein AAFC00_005459 [Neodothiora populina]|uniref:Zn(2)-C6 fungal-type domain-containing protein n=1 Tax=Neodothiora populina TaxID=2781224 RepID=A0ABR3PM20_9PEZI
MAARTGSNDSGHSHSDSQSPGDNYFNDLSRQPTNTIAPNEQQPKSKRMACVLCRKRKLKCDGAKPACATCARLSHECVYDEIRKKSGPKRGYVKALEARLAQVETMLKTQDTVPLERNEPASASASTSLNTSVQVQGDYFGDASEMDIGIADDSLQWTPGLTDLMTDPANNLSSIMTNLQDKPATSTSYQETWGSMIGLDVEEPLPLPECVEELSHLYFQKVHPTMPVIHRPRFLMAMANSLSTLRPPVTLQYILWALAGSVSDRYATVHRHYYDRARYYFERDEMRGQGEGIVDIAHVQALLLISSYEFKYLMFPRAWSSTGRAARLALMLGLHRVDGAALDVKQCLPPAKDWIETEERRRTYWCCFQEDRAASMGTGWPMAFEEADVMTHLPSSDHAYETGNKETSISLEEALRPGGAAKLSPLGGVSVLCCLFGRNLLHLHRSGPNNDDDSPNGAFWARHRALDDIILHISLAAPDALRLPIGLNNPNVVYMNMCLHTATICLHQAAIFKAEKHRALLKISAESKMRCITAAIEIANIMRLTSHQDMSGMNPFTCFCLYVASRVFVQYIKSRPRDGNIRSSLFLLLSAMHATKKRNPLAESFLVQLDVDLEMAGLHDMRDLSSTVANNSVTPRGGCMTEWVMPNGDHNLAVFGNNGVAMHSSTSMNEANIEQQQQQQQQRDAQPTVHFTTRKLDTRNPTATATDATTTFYTSGSMPVRNKSPSMDRSPHAISIETDMNGSGASNGPTPPSLRADSSSGRVSSISSISPPSLTIDDPFQHNKSQKKGSFNTGILAGVPDFDQNMTYSDSELFDFSTGTSPGSGTTADNYNSARQGPSGRVDGNMIYGVDVFAGRKYEFRPPESRLDDSISPTATATGPKTTLAGTGGGGAALNVSDLSSMTDAEFQSIMNGIAGWEAEIATANSAPQQRQHQQFQQDQQDQRQQGQQQQQGYGVTGF